MTVVASLHDGITQDALALRSREERLACGTQRCGVAKVFGFGLFEARGELVGVVEDFLCGSGHRNHLRNFGPAGMAWTRMGPSALSMTPISVDDLDDGFVIFVGKHDIHEDDMRRFQRSMARPRLQVSLRHEVRKLFCERSKTRVQDPVLYV